MNDIENTKKSTKKKKKKASRTKCVQPGHGIGQNTKINHFSIPTDEELETEIQKNHYHL